MSDKDASTLPVSNREFSQAITLNILSLLIINIRHVPLLEKGS